MAPPSFPAIAGCFLFHAALNQASPIVGSNSYVPASNAVQTSIIKQQIYNLCLFEHSLNLCNETCKPYGTLTLTPVQVIASLTEGSGYGTFVASPLTEYAGLQHPTTILTSDGYGIPTTLPIGELGQGMLIESPSFGSCTKMFEFGRNWEGISRVNIQILHRHLLSVLLAEVIS
jgi:hypothetical protein